MRRIGLLRRAFAVGLIAFLCLAGWIPGADLAVRDAGARVACPEPPGLSNPTRIQITSKRRSLELNSSRDYIIEFPNRAVGRVFISGGRHVLIDGGHIVMRNPRGSDMSRRALYLKGQTGVVQVCNFLIEGKKGSSFDAIAISAPRAEIRLNTVRVTGVHGRSNGYHGDLLQAFGGVDRLVVENFTGYTSYQGFYLVETGGRIGPVTLRRVNLQYLPNSKDRTTVMLWFDGCGNYAVNLDQVYIKPRGSQRIGQASVRPSTGNGGCAANQNGNQVTWPGNVDGSVIEGRPSADFVPAGSVP